MKVYWIIPDHIHSSKSSLSPFFIFVPGVEYFQDLIDQGLVKKVKSVEELGKVIKTDDKSTIIDGQYFFSKRREINLWKKYLV